MSKFKELKEHKKITCPFCGFDMFVGIDTSDEDGEITIRCQDEDCRQKFQLVYETVKLFSAYRYDPNTCDGLE